MWARKQGPAMSVKQQLLTTITVAAVIEPIVVIAAIAA
jgi:hypothetical protein